VDLLLLGDGYIAAEMDKWHKDARRMADLLFAVSPFKERKSDFNVWAVDAPAEESGISRPSDGVYRRSPLGATYDAFGSERYILTFDDKRLREIAAAAPYEFLEIVVNGRKYGGGGIFNLYATAAADNAWTPYVFVHEFGHHFAGLADEYYTSDVAYESTAARPEPWEPNVTADPKAARWKDLILPGTPLPTIWPKEAFERLQKEFKPNAGKSALRSAPKVKWRTFFARSRGRRPGSSPRGPMQKWWGRSRGPCMKLRDTIAPRPTALCSHATKSVSAPSAAAPLSASSTCTRARFGVRRLDGALFSEAN
jgi:hypothetical protein